MAEIIKISKPMLLALVFGNLVGWGLAVHQYIMFLRAYASPSKGIVLMIDVFHEADIEIVLMTFSIILATFSTFYILYCIRKNKCIVYTPQS